MFRRYLYINTVGVFVETEFILGILVKIYVNILLDVGILNITFGNE